MPKRPPVTSAGRYATYTWNECPSLASIWLVVLIEVVSRAYDMNTQARLNANLQSHVPLSYLQICGSVFATCVSLLQLFGGAVGAGVDDFSVGKLAAGVSSWWAALDPVQALLDEPAASPSESPVIIPSRPPVRGPLSSPPLSMR